MNIVVVGAGYVGLTIAGGFAKLGHRVTCVEKSRARVAVLRKGALPFYEPDLAQLIAGGLHEGTLRIEETLASAGSGADVIFVSVGTPAGPGGEPDVSAVEEVVRDLVGLSHLGIVAFKSTIPVGTIVRVERCLNGRGAHAGVAYTPEFLSEGTAVADFFHPHRVIIGTTSEKAARTLSLLYQPLHCPILVTDPTTAETIKYASNAALATRISFINEIGMLCERTGADLSAVATGIGLDPRIGPHFLKAGIGFGGSCLPKDMHALRALVRKAGIVPTLLDAVQDVNEAAWRAFVDKVAAALDGLAGRTVAAFGLAFKGGTSDVRESPALYVAEHLAASGAAVRAYDPVAGLRDDRAQPGVTRCGDPYEAARGSHALLFLNDSPEFGRLDWARLRAHVRRPLVLDGRGLGFARTAEEAGFTYIGPGQGVPLRAAAAHVPAAETVFDQVSP